MWLHSRKHNLETIMPDNFTMQPQQETEWCWAATAASVHSYLNPGCPTIFTQASLASTVLQQEKKIAPGFDCTGSPGSCDFPGSLTIALTTTGNLNTALGRPMEFSEIKAALDNGNPVCVQIDWYSGGGHAIAIDGYFEYASGAQVVSVQDPLLPGATLHFYDALKTGYQASGVWADTFTVQRHP
jgi:hypothetical protein